MGVKKYILIVSLFMGIMFSVQPYALSQAEPDKPLKPLWLEKLEEQNRKSDIEWAKIVAGECAPLEPYSSSCISVSSSKQMFVAGAMTAVAGASLTFAYRSAVVGAGAVLKYLGYGTLAAGLSAAGFAVAAGSIVVFNPGYAKGAEFTQSEIDMHQLKDISKAQVAFDMMPNNIYLQKNEIQAQIRFQKYQVARIKDLVENSRLYSEAYRAALHKGTLVKSKVDYISLLEKEEAKLLADVKKLESDYWSGKNNLASHLMEQSEKVHRDLRKEEFMRSIAELTQLRKDTGELHWSRMIQELYEGKIHLWLKLMFYLDQQQTLKININ